MQLINPHEFAAKGPHSNKHDTVVATDGELLVRFARHADHRAFSQLVERHGGLVWIVCREMLQHRQDVEDAFQATFLILAQRASSIRSSDSAAAWLHRVAQRTALAARRKRARLREEELVEDASDSDAGQAEISHRELIYVLLDELRKLPDRYQVPLVLRYFERMTRLAIAALTDSTVAQIQGRLVRGRRMLRSRMLRRGVSLSLATGAVADVSTDAEAAVTPAIATATAKRCLARKTSGDTTGITPAALWLAQQGAKAMWLTFVAKYVAVVSLVAVAGGLLLAAQVSGPGNTADDSASAQVELQGDAQNADASGAGSGQRNARAVELAGRFKYKIPIEIGDTEFRDGGHIVIEEVWGTRPRIEVGGQFLVRGKYLLPRGQRGKLYFYETATGNWGREATANMDLQIIELDKESGEFQLVHGMAGPGYFHLYLAAPEKYSQMFANVYFGTGDNVLKQKDSSAPKVNDANAREMKELRDKVQELESANADLRRHLAEKPTK